MHCSSRLIVIADVGSLTSYIHAIINIYNFKSVNFIINNVATKTLETKQNTSLKLHK